MIVRNPPLKPRKDTKVTARGAKGKPSLKQHNGLVGAVLKVDDVDVARPAARVKSKRAARSLAGATAASPAPLTRRDPEATARQCLERALEKTRPAAAATGATDPGKPEFRSLGAEAVRLTGTTMVKFRQTFHKIPVYGSLVTVEIDRKNRCLGINSSLGMPKGVRHRQDLAREGSGRRGEGIGLAAVATHEHTAATLLLSPGRLDLAAGVYRRKRTPAQAQESRRRSQRCPAQGLRRRCPLRQVAGRPAAHVDHGIGDGEGQGWSSRQPAHRRREKGRRTSRTP